MQRNPRFKRAKDSKVWNPMEEFVALNKGLANGFAFNAAGLDDYRIVMVATSLIDQFLRFGLVLRFRPYGGPLSKALLDEVFSGTGPLSTFSSKISVGGALGAFRPDEKHDLRILKTIRNSFAHSPVPLALKDQSACLSLKMISGRKDMVDDVPERLAFRHSCTSIIAHLSIASIVGLAEMIHLNNGINEVREIAERMTQAIFQGDEGLAQEIARRRPRPGHG